MGAALVLLLVGLGAMAAGVLIGRYYVPDDRQLRRTARHSRAYMRALGHLVVRDHDAVVSELRSVVEENIEDVEPYFTLGAVFRSRGEHERAIRVHQALAVRERDRRKLRQRAMHELGLDFRAAGMPRRATRAMEEVLLEEPDHEGALRVLAALYEEQARFNEAAELWQRLGRRRGEDTSEREHHLLVAAAQAALGRDDIDSAKQLLKAAQKLEESAHFFAAAAELAAARDNHRGAKERLKQALIADAALAPHLLPGLIAAEQGLVRSDQRARQSADELDPDGFPSSVLPRAIEDAPSAPVPQLAAAAPRALPSGEAIATAPATDAPASSAAMSDAVGAAASDASSTGASPAGASPTGASPTGASSTGASPTVAVASSAAASAPSSEMRTVTLSTVARRTERVTTAMRSATEPAAANGAGELSRVVADGVLALLAEVEAQAGARLEIALIRAQLIPPADAAARAALAGDLTARYPDALAARVATARLAIADDDPGAIRAALEALVADKGAIAWALHGRWQCTQCGNRPGAFSWRCGQCRRWSTLHMETGVEPPPVAPRERRAVPRGPRPEALLGATPDEALPAPTLDPGLSDAELASAGTRRSLLGRVGGWVSGILRREA